MLTIILLLALVIIFDIAALYRGNNSSEEPESKEWERREQFAWYA